MRFSLKKLFFTEGKTIRQRFIVQQSGVTYQIRPLSDLQLLYKSFDNVNIYRNKIKKTIQYYMQRVLHDQIWNDKFAIVRYAHSRLE